MIIEAIRAAGTIEGLKLISKWHTLRIVMRFNEILS